MVGQRRVALGREPFGGFLDLLARQAIDDAGLALAPGQEAEQLFCEVLTAVSKKDKVDENMVSKVLI